MTDQAELFETLYNCRAMRRLDTREVPEEALLKLVDAANQAPSGSNMQNGRWIIVRDANVKQQLAELNRQAVEAYIGPIRDKPQSLPHQDEGKRTRMMDAVWWQMEHLHEVPALIIACLEFEGEVDELTRAVSGGSIWPGVQNLLLAARAMELGAAPTTLALQDPQAVAKALNLPPNMSAYCLIPVGYPLGKFGPVSRKPVSDITRFDTWS